MIKYKFIYILKNYFYKKFLCFVLFFIQGAFVVAQVSSPTPSSPLPLTTNPSLNKIITVQFFQKSVELKKSEIVSNVLKLVNNSDKVISFSLELTYPYGWKSLLKNNLTYEIKSKDTLYVPVRIIPTTEFKGNMQYLINIFVMSEENKQLASDYFFAATKKVVKWEMNILPRDRVYFLNGEKSSPFAVNLLNVGNENQDILLTLNEIGRNVIIKDTTGKIIRKRFFDVNLDPSKDTTYYFNMSYYDGDRNHKRIDNENYIPKSGQEDEKYTLYMRSAESKQGTQGVFKIGKKIDFIKLSNIKKATPFGSSVIPVIADANIYNILGNQPMMNLVLKGNTVLSNGANLNYFTQVNYSAYSYSDKIFKNNAWVIGYSTKKWGLQLGNVAVQGGASSISGRGVSGYYIINEKQSVNAFFSKSPGFLGKTNNLAFGGSHRYILPNNWQLRTIAGQSVNYRLKSTSDYFGERLSFDISTNHRFGIGITGTRVISNFIPTNKITTYNYILNASYNGDYFKKRLSLNLNGNYNPKNTITGYDERLLLAHRSIYKITDKYTTMLYNNYNRYSSPYYINGSFKIVNNTLFTNQLFLVKGGSVQKIMPSIFYNITDISNNQLHYRGLGLDYNYFSLEKNFRFSTAIKGGYNDIINYPKIKEYFTFQIFTLCQYQNISVNIRYNYGPQSINIIDSTLGYLYPQYIYLSLQHQYLFKDTRFMLQTSGNYSFSNTAFSHNFGIYPELYFFSYNGWRFKLNIGYNLNISNRNKANLYNSAITNNIPKNENVKPSISNSFTMGAGIRKEFGIPIPKKYSKQRFYDVSFIAFLDMNGNRVKDRDEVALENVVIRLGDYEVLTNDLGMAKLLNVKQDNYLFSVISLGEVKGWFPLKMDSILINNNQKQYIPFVKGVKLAGNIAIDREKFALNAETPLDLSKIRISVTDSLGNSQSTLTDVNGSYLLYVPSGKYILTMDEKILGERFFLAQNNIEVELKIGMEGFFNTFYIIEKKRKINLKKAQ